ncbi:phage tail protein, partial [Xenorhabdus sp. Sc-CR9]|uniref:phage tail protein n=1 Tax=Xenorhabdus sp. Sc-CR9 TaxID=2584468 RepID=UPI001F18EFC7
EFDGAAKETAITTTAETWQIDFTARLSGMDDMQRLINTDSYGEAAFFEEGFAVVRQGEQYLVKKGLAYVGGLRGVLEFDQTLNAMRNTRVYADFSYQGNLVSQWKTVVKITVANELQNYIDAAGYPHYVFAVASIDANGDVMDLRIKGSLSDRDITELNQRFNVIMNDKLAKSQNGADIPDKNIFINNLGLSDTRDKAQNAVPHSRMVNGKTLINDISLNAADVGAINNNQLGQLGNGGKFQDCLSTGFYRVAVPHQATVSDFPIVSSTEHLYGYGILEVNNASGVISQRYTSHMGQVVVRQSWSSGNDWLGWCTIYSSAQKPSADDIGSYSKFVSDEKYQPKSHAGQLHSGGRFSDCVATGIYHVFGAHADSVADFPRYTTGQALYDFGVLEVYREGELISQRYTAHSGEIAVRQAFPGSPVLGNWFIYSKQGFDLLYDNIPVGSPIPWPLPNPPTGYLECKGQSFDKSTCPRLAQAYPSGVLPDLRGEFIRGLDNARGIDPGRIALSWQADEFRSHNHTVGGHYGGDSLGGESRVQTYGTEQVSSRAGGNETRPRNIAFLYIVRAA